MLQTAYFPVPLFSPSCYSCFMTHLKHLFHVVRFLIRSIFSDDYFNNTVCIFYLVLFTFVVSCLFFYVHVIVHRKNFFVIKPTTCTNFTNLFCHETLHVSDSSSVHHQEFIHCTLSNGICHTGL